MQYLQGKRKGGGIGPAAWERAENYLASKGKKKGFGGEGLG